MTRPGFVTWFGLAVVLIAAAALSFNSLRELAVACRVPPTLAPLLPVCVDSGAAVATRAWLSGRTGPVAERFARRMTWAMLALTVTGNATHQLMNAQGVPPWLLAVMVIVGAVPAGVMGAAVHLAVLLGRDAGRQTGAGVSEPPTPEAVGSSTGALPVSVRDNAPVATEPLSTQVESTPVKARAKRSTVVAGTDRTSAETKARALVAADPTIGRRALMSQSGLREYDARKLLETERAKPRNGHPVLEEAR